MIASQIHQGRKVELCGKTYYIVSHLRRLQVGAGAFVQFCEIMRDDQNISFPMVIEALDLPKDDPERQE